MATERVRKNIPNTEATIDQKAMAANFTSMCKNVSKMIKTNGPVYSTWIRIQLGSTEPVIFDSSSTALNKNLIAQLTFNKSGAGVANDFTLVVQYDPFNNGQNSNNQVDILDEYLATALSYNVTENNKKLIGTIQYGYNYTEDTNLVSPVYHFILTQAESKMKWSTGLTTYTFEGTSILATDCEFNATYDKIEGWGLIDYVAWVLYYYYGDPENPPKGVSKGEEQHPSASKYKYKLSIPESLYENQRNDITKEATNGISPWQYCKDLLEEYPLSKTDLESGNYENLQEIPANKRPRYMMYLNDSTNTIYINYTTPIDDSGLVKLGIDFKWNSKENNIVTDWNPGVDLRLYLIQKACKLRGIENTQEGSEVSDEIFECYDSTITLLGIPTDVPLGATVKIIPKVLESESRTAGIYMIRGATDTISNQGVFSTELQVLRIGSKYEKRVPGTPKTNVETDASTGKTLSTAQGGSVMTREKVKEKYDKMFEERKKSLGMGTSSVPKVRDLTPGSLSGGGFSR